ncbi:protein of unknown function [Pedococcus dokdonensis]|uniref:DUF5063 domain-containing protein n=1 Tax=Pedococcus dokdonensis TaxID=443156 RepID=A0A1H0UGB9_9MICO|nr:DUF5063 domain-containing protein [Pedococcus dokdonensis]SDP65267.1 protein of unknown function [Pedococcus dokdonensis]
MSDDLQVLADDCAGEARTFLSTMTEVASGSEPAAAMPMTLLALSQVLLMGSRLGAIEDVVPEERFEADPGPDVDVDPLRSALANLFEGLDDYAYVVDPLVDVEVARSALSEDVAEIASALSHGLRHYEAGRASEALWWWQFSYLSTWGDAGARSLRAMVSLLAHIRLDADEESVSEAEFDALHP